MEVNDAVSFDVKQLSLVILHTLNT